MRESNCAGSVGHCIALSVNRESVNCWLTVRWGADQHVSSNHALVTYGDILVMCWLCSFLKACLIPWQLKHCFISSQSAKLSVSQPSIYSWCCNVNIALFPIIQTHLQIYHSERFFFAHWFLCCIGNYSVMFSLQSVWTTKTHPRTATCHVPVWNRNRLQKASSAHKCI